MAVGRWNCQWEWGFWGGYASRDWGHAAPHTLTAGGQLNDEEEWLPSKGISVCLCLTTFIRTSSLTQWSVFFKNMYTSKDNLLQFS